MFYIKRHNHCRILFLKHISKYPIFLSGSHTVQSLENGSRTLSDGDSEDFGESCLFPLSAQTWICKFRLPERVQIYKGISSCIP